MQHYTFYLNISTDELLRYYNGSAQRLVVRSEQGLVLQLPVERVRPFVTASGVQGYFCLRADSNNRFVSMERLPPR